MTHHVEHLHSVAILVAESRAAHGRSSPVEPLPRLVRERVGPEAVEREGGGIGRVVHDHVDRDSLSLSRRLVRRGEPGCPRNETRANHRSN